MLSIEHGAVVAPRSNRKRLGVGFALIGLLMLPVTSLQAAENTITLQTAIQRTLVKNPSLKVFDFRQQALKGELATAELRPAYELDFGAENFAGSGDFNGFDQAELTISLSSALELGGKRDARVEVVNRGFSRFEAQRQADALDLSGEVTRRFIDVLAAQQRVALAEKADQLAKDALVAVKTRAKAGASPDAEVKRAEAAAAQAHLTVSAEKKQLSYLNVALGTLWGETRPDFNRAEGDLYRFSKDVAFETLYERVELNPAIQVFAAEERLKETELRLAKTQSRSDVNWSVGLRRFQETDDTAVVAGFSVPLFSGRRNSGAIRSATAARDVISVQREAALLAMRAQLYRAYSNRQQAIHTVDDLRKNIVPALEQALEGTQQAYERGRYSYVDYVSARQELLSARRTLIDAAAAALRYGADIEQLTAEPLTVEQYSFTNFQEAK
ncbi:MAG: RND transporter [Cellvibrionaceae bacterium]|nr:RND transporter [Cellvibrionaceae bacterium]